MAREVKFKGSPLTLIGPELKAGGKAPDFRAIEAVRGLFAGVH